LWAASTPDCGCRLRIEASDPFESFFGLEGFGEGYAFPKRLIRSWWGDFSCQGRAKRAAKRLFFFEKQSLTRKIARAQLLMWFVWPQGSPKPHPKPFSVCKRTSIVSKGNKVSLTDSTP
jgi:hypothetical protein